MGPRRHLPCVIDFCFVYQSLIELGKNIPSVSSRNFRSQTVSPLCNRFLFLFSNRKLNSEVTYLPYLPETSETSIFSILNEINEPRMASPFCDRLRSPSARRQFNLEVAHPFAVAEPLRRTRNSGQPGTSDLRPSISWT